ncbi:putative IQ motif and ankyrin repeat domain-containing protein LOC642574 [Clonorchis sinensis]|uniref:IQ motif and ankyrin repeat domain-containing protein LOC642574 n=1 Tax=Clonorchis sinensis TaxID=79923 RepID=A0A8T1MQ48_CLOSI|nr:putative IQ motif and ankyrin repeat domain-containing protein LOC642574 [Clonorchis sinensis]
MPTRHCRTGRSQKVQDSILLEPEKHVAEERKSPIASDEADANSPDPVLVEASIMVQKYVRRYLAQQKLKKLKMEKIRYEEQVEELSRQAYLKMVQKYREEQERKRLKEQEEEERVRLANRRKKCMLESAYEGKVVQMRALLQQLIDEDENSGIGDDDIGRATKLRHIKELIECEDANRNSALSEACIGGSLEAVKFLIDHGANVNSRGQFGRTPLYRAVFGGHLDVSQILLQHGADPRLYADDGQRPIEIASDVAIHDLLENWDISETDMLLRQINLYHKQEEAQLSRGTQAMLTKLKSSVQQCEKTYQIIQKKVCKAYEVLNKRILEYETAKVNGYENLSLLEQIIHDAELHVESTKVELDKAREKLQQARLDLRDEQRKDKRKNSDDDRPGIVCSLKDLDDILFRDVGNRLGMAGKWPLVVDPSDRASTFLRYRDTNYVNILNPRQLEPEKLRISLLGALRYGKPMVVDLMELDSTFENLCRSRFESIKSTLMEDIIEQRIREPFVYEDLIRTTDPDEFSKSMFIQRNLQRFSFILLTKNPFPEENLMQLFIPVWVEP